MNSSALRIPAEVRDTPKAPLVLLQSLRAAAAGMIVIFHLDLWWPRYFPRAALFPQGFSACEAGVDLFFVISGFIMMHITPRAHRSWRDQGAFLFRRFSRIYPAYWAIAIPLLLLWWWRPGLVNNSQGNRLDVPASLLLYPSVYAPVLFVGWTLVCELIYYVIASFLFYLEGVRRLVGIGVWLVVILGANVLHPHNFANPWTNTVLIALTVEFIGGMILAEVLRRGMTRIDPRLAGGLVLAALGWLFAAGTWHGSYVGAPEHLSRVGLYGVPAFVIVWMILQMDLQGEWRWLARLAPLGDRSYSLYLLHIPVIAMVYRVLALVLPDSSRWEMGIVLLMVVAAMVIPIECLHRFVERPAHALARRLTSGDGRGFLH